MPGTSDKPKLKTSPTPVGIGAASAQPTLRMLLRLAGWGFCAALALGVTVTLSQTDRGAERIQQAVASLYSPAGGQTKPTAEAVAKMAEPAPDPQAENRRLARQMELEIQRLAADRDRLASRVAMLERNFDDITGSVKQIATARITPAPPSTEAAKSREPSKQDVKEAAAVAASSPRPANDNAPTRPSPPPPSVADAAAPAVAAPPPVRLSALPQIKGTAKDVAAPQNRDDHKSERKNESKNESRNEPKSEHQAVVVREPLPKPAVTAPSTLPAKLDFGIDLGGASTIEGLRALWASTRVAHAPLLDALQPAAILRPTGKNGAPQLRLMAGPFADAGAAAAVCRAFAPGRGMCRPFAFDGQKLPLH